MLSKLAVSTLFASLALASPLALPAAFAEAMANPQLPGSTVECHAFCGNAILKWRECGGNSDAATKECTCAPDSEYTQLIHPCLQCGESLWYAYSKFLEESLLLCGLPTAPTGTVVTSAAPATSAPASSSIEPPAQSTTAAPQSSLAPEPSSEPAPIASSSAPGSVALASSEPASTPASVAPGSTAPVSSVESSAAPGSSAIQSSAQSAPASESSEVEPSSVASSVIGGTSSFHVPSPQITETAYFTNGTTVTDKVTLTTCESCTKSTRSTITYTATITKTDSDGKHAVVTETVTYCPEDGVPVPSSVTLTPGKTTTVVVTTHIPVVSSGTTTLTAITTTITTCPPETTPVVITTPETTEVVKPTPETTAAVETTPVESPKPTTTVVVTKGTQPPPVAVTSGPTTIAQVNGAPALTGAGALIAAAIAGVIII